MREWMNFTLNYKISDLLNMLAGLFLEIGLEDITTSYSS